MADNVNISQGDGSKVIATDDVSGVQYQVIKVDLGGDGASSPLVRGQQARTSSLPAALSTEDAALIGATNETAPIDDTASSGLNGRLQRVAQRLTVLLLRIGESQASPTQYTISDRLKVLGDATGTTADVEASSGNGTLVAISKRLRTLLGGGLPSALSSDRLKTEATGAASEAHLGEVGGRTRVISATLTRPSDTTAYAAGDAVTNSTSAPSVITFADCARVANGSGVIVGVTMVDSANQSTAGQFELWLFDTTFTPDNDNSPFTPTDAECATLVGIVPLSLSYVGDATSGAGGNRVYIASNLNIPFQCTGGSDDLYGALPVRNAYTPVSAETFTIRLRILQD